MMPEEKKFFDKEKQEKAVNWINQKCPNLKCECCHQTTWSLAGDLVMPMPFTGGAGLIIGGASYPQLQIVCNNCGNTKFFNAVVMGLATGSAEVKNG